MSDNFRAETERQMFIVGRVGNIRDINTSDGKKLTLIRVYQDIPRVINGVYQFQREWFSVFCREQLAERCLKIIGKNDLVSASGRPDFKVNSEGDGVDLTLNAFSVNILSKVRKRRIDEK